MSLHYARAHSFYCYLNSLVIGTVKNKKQSVYIVYSVYTVYKVYIHRKELRNENYLVK
jgi:hypothetical protein